ncbi:MAG: heme-binding protein [Rhodothermales bacterium]
MSLKVQRIQSTVLFLLLSIIVVSCQSTKDATKDEAPPTLNLPAGFSYDHLYSPSKFEKGTWVSLAFDDEGRLYASDQHGYLYRMTIPAIGAEGEMMIEKVEVELGHAQGLLWAFDGLYVSVNTREGMGGNGNGLYKVTDTDGDDRLDHVETLHIFDGAPGEHGPHSIVMSPDGESLYMIAGNHTDPPEGYIKQHAGPWMEDQLLPSVIDPRGHANERMAPGGWIASFNPDGSDFEVVGSGFRNPFDLAFNSDGELLAFDADMEWDMGMPWYRPIRVNHVTSASEFGWRTGTGKWPAYYPDNLPGIVNIGQGSPTGVMMGNGGAFPARYQKGMFIFDWSFGTIYLVEMEPDGSSYTGSFEEFVSGKPLPVTDGVWGQDGAMYVATGGRNLESHLYRVYYTGEESTDPVDTKTANADQRALRHSLEKFHTEVSPDAVEMAWPYMNHEDRYIRYAARLAIERQPVGEWWNLAVYEPDPVSRLHGIIALARSSDATHQYVALEALTSIDFKGLSYESRLDLLRAYALVFIRMGEPGAHWREKSIAALLPHFPSGDFYLDRELSRVLVYLDAPEAVAKTLALLQSASTVELDIPILSETLTARHDRYGKDIETMKANMPSAAEIAHAVTLSNAKSGWTMDLRKSYLQWYFDSMSRSGGRSYVGFLDQFRQRALSNIPADEQEALADLVVEFNEPAVDFASLPQPVGPGKNWMQGEVKRMTGNDEIQLPRNYEQGKKMYAAALCEACHSMQGMGGNIGPDLSQVGTRFGRNDIIEAIISPSDAIADQYQATLFELHSGSSIIGRVISQDDEMISLNQNPFDPTQKTTVKKSDVMGEKPSPASIMPAGLLNRLNQDEVIDLIAYLVASGDPAHEMFSTEIE